MPFIVDHRVSEVVSPLLYPHPNADTLNRQVGIVGFAAKAPRRPYHRRPAQLGEHRRCLSGQPATFQRLPVEHLIWRRLLVGCVKGNCITVLRAARSMAAQRVRYPGQRMIGDHLCRKTVSDDQLTVAGPSRPKPNAGELSAWVR